MRTALPESPQGEAISFTGDNQQLVVASEGVPGDVVVVPIPAGAASAAAGAVGRPGAEPQRAHQLGRSPITSALIAAAVATVVVWVGGVVRRRSKP